MRSYVNPDEQLVLALYVSNISDSSEFYQSFGFEIVRDEGTFRELRWENGRLFLSEIPGTPTPPANPIGNIRIMVPNVDDHWIRSKKMGATIIRPIDDRPYGLREFIIAGPDGLALRFATLLSDLS